MQYIGFFYLPTIDLLKLIRVVVSSTIFLEVYGFFVNSL